MKNKNFTFYLMELMDVMHYQKEAEEEEEEGGGGGE
jgi:hypothetical protein